MKTYERVLANLKARRERVLSGKLNCIPFDLPRFTEFLPGIEQGKYLIISANHKIGKTQITDWLYLYTPLLYAFYNPTQIRVKIHYFTWEMSAEEKYTQAISFLLYYLSNGQIRIAPMDLRSTNAKRPLSAQILALLDKEPYKSLLDFLDANVNFIDSIKNPTGVQIYLEEFAKNNGIIHKKKQTFRNPETGELYEKEVFDYFEPNDPDEYWIGIFDHLSLVSPEMGLTLRDTMGKLSANVLVPLKSKYKFCFVGVQQQAQQQESIENMKMNRLKPTADGLADNKALIRDVDLCLGLYGPFRYGIKEHEGYDIQRMKDSIRFLEIIAGRQGGGGNVCPLYFDGAVNFFKELPLPSDTANINAVYNLVQNLNNPPKTVNLIINTNEDTNFSKKRIWKKYKYWQCSRTWYKRFKPIRDLFNKLCE